MQLLSGASPFSHLVSGIELSFFSDPIAFESGRSSPSGSEIRMEKPRTFNLTLPFESRRRVLLKIGCCRTDLAGFANHLEGVVEKDFRSQAVLSLHCPTHFLLEDGAK